MTIGSQVHSLVDNAITELLILSLTTHIMGPSIVDLEKSQVGIAFPHLVPNAGAFVSSCFLGKAVVRVGQAERGGR